MKFLLISLLALCFIGCVERYHADDKFTVESVSLSGYNQIGVKYIYTIKNYYSIGNEKYYSALYIYSDELYSVGDTLILTKENK